MKELIDEMSYDLAECHVDYLDDAKLYTDYDTMAQKMVSRGYRKQSEWISVEDKLPEMYEDVLCYSGHSFYVDFICSDGTWCDDEIRNEKITHWMPLPQPPKGE